MLNISEIYSYIAQHLQLISIVIVLVIFLGLFFLQLEFKSVLHRTINAEQELLRSNYQLRESEGYKTAILEAASDSIVTITEQGVMVSFNRKTAEIFKYPPEELKNKNINVLVPDLFKKIKPQLGKLAIEFVGIRKGGEHFPAELSISRAYLTDQYMFVCVIRDITERKKIERIKNDFISVVSHELRTPLTSILGSLGLLLGGAVGTFPEKAKSLLEIANNNCEHLLLLINDILDMEKIEAERMVFQLKAVEIEQLVVDAMIANKMYAEKFDVTLQLVQSLPGVKVNVDSGRLMQVLANLISNAVKFSPPKGEVSLGILLHDNKVRVSVTDKGSGIPKEFQSHIFQKFSQADSSNTRQKGGTGLGLSISKSMIEKMAGTLHFKSNPAVETTFYFDLPKWEEAKQ